jgi:hypothetical protein
LCAVSLCVCEYGQILFLQRWLYVSHRGDGPRWKYACWVCSDVGAREREREREERERDGGSSMCLLLVVIAWVLRPVVAGGGGRGERMAKISKRQARESNAQRSLYVCMYIFDRNSQNAQRNIQTRFVCTT